MKHFVWIGLGLIWALAATPAFAKMGVDGYGPDDLEEQQATATAYAAQPTATMTPAVTRTAAGHPTAVARVKATAVPSPVWKERDVLGTWWTQKKDSQIEIYAKEDGLYYGKIVWVLPEKAGKLDVKNHDPKKRTQLILGSDIFFHLKFDGKTKWDGGALYDPRGGDTYQGDLRLETHDRMVVEGFINLPIIGRVGAGQKFSRVPPGELNLSETPTITVTPGKK
jgi:uncharacterized protein (DUF2147 family)